MPLRGGQPALLSNFSCGGAAAKGVTPWELRNPARKAERGLLGNNLERRSQLGIEQPATTRAQNQGVPF